MLPDRPIPFSTLQEMAKKGEDHRTNSDKSLSKGVVAVVSGICWQPQASFPVFHFLYIRFLTVLELTHPIFLLANTKLAQSSHLGEASIFGCIFFSQHNQSIDMTMIVGY